MTDQTPPERFRNRKCAWNWLVAEGVPVSRGKFYNDCAAGDILLHRDKSVSKASVEAYGRRIESSLPIPSPATASLAGVKAELEVEKLRLEVARLERAGRAGDREWLRTEDGWVAIAGCLGTLLDNLRHQSDQAAPALIELITTCADDANLPARVAEMVEQLVIAPAMNDLGPTIEGVFEGVEDEDGAGPEAREATA